jgi:hypothetical protein
MERLTSKIWRNLEPWECCGQEEYCKRDCHEKGGCANGCIVPRLYSRLARYEDLGLLPEEIDELLHRTTGPLHRKLGFWIDADKTSHLRILPCKPGDMVWRICGQRGKKHVAQRRVESIEYTASGEIWIHSTACDVFGKTVFLTREEAEAALKGATL